jgi:hypothetical protein
MAELEERNEYINVFEELKKRLEENNPLSGIQYDIEIRHGLAQETIPALVKKEQVDLVVLCNIEINELLEKSKTALAAEIREKVACPVRIAPTLASADSYIKTEFGASLKRELYSSTALRQELAEI